MQESRARKIKIGLAGLVVLGVGVASTSAMWSDNVWFQGDVTSSKFNLQGSLDGSTNWLESGSGTSIELTVPTAAELSPGIPVTKKIYVKNAADSTHPANLSAPVVEVADGSPLKGVLEVKAVYADALAAASLAKGATVAVDLTYTLTPAAGTSATDNLGLQGQTASFTVKIVGTEVVS